MSLHEQWKKIIEEASTDEEKQRDFWVDYCEQEKNIYQGILANKNAVVEGTVKELAQKYNMEIPYFIGFLDGINDSIKDSLDISSLEEESTITLEINFRELYKNMLAVPAEWLYNLEEWSNIFTEKERKEISKEYNKSKTFVNTNKVGRNDPCPCGSGKKYKKCCGAN